MHLFSAKYKDALVFFLKTLNDAGFFLPANACCRGCIRLNEKINRFMPFLEENMTQQPGFYFSFLFFESRYSKDVLNLLNVF